MPTELVSANLSMGRVQIALIGCNHRTAPLELRERIVFTPEQAMRASDELRLSGTLEEALVLSTCNRSELYGVSPISNNDVQSVMERLLADFHGLSPAELNGRVYRENNTEAVRHLFRVASGLDSMLLGEAEILGQVREAYGRALEHGSTGPVLNRLFQSALEVGKRVRTETEVGTRPMSVAWAGVKLAEQVFGDLEGHEAVIIGAGAVAEKVVEHLRDRGIGRLVVVNRSRERAEDLARRMGGESADWAALETALEPADIIVTRRTAGERSSLWIWAFRETWSRRRPVSITFISTTLMTSAKLWSRTAKRAKRKFRARSRSSPSTSRNSKRGAAVLRRSR